MNKSVKTQAVRRGILFALSFLTEHSQRACSKHGGAPQWPNATLEGNRYGRNMGNRHAKSRKQSRVAAAAHNDHPQQVYKNSDDKQEEEWHPASSRGSKTSQKVRVALEGSPGLADRAQYAEPSLSSQVTYTVALGEERGQSNNLTHSKRLKLQYASASLQPTAITKSGCGSLWPQLA